MYKMPFFTRKKHPDSDPEIKSEEKIAKAYETTTGEQYNADKHSKMQAAMEERMNKYMYVRGGKTRRRSSARKQNKSKKHHKKSKKHRKKHHNKKSKKHRKK